MRSCFDHTFYGYNPYHSLDAVQVIDDIGRCWQADEPIDSVCEERWYPRALVELVYQCITFDFDLHARAPSFISFEPPIDPLDTPAGMSRANEAI